MANYFVLNNKFTPYSFDELIKPYQMYAKEYDKEEAALEAAGEKEFTAADLSSNPDSAAYKMYSEATSALQAASNELATKGLSGDLRNRIKTVARDYKRTMGNLTDAQDRLDKELALRAKEGDNHVYQQSTLSIDDFLGGKTPNQRGQKLDVLTTDVAAEFQKRAAGITRDTWDKVFASSGEQIKGYYDVTTATGLTDAQLDIILDGVVTGDGSKWKAAMKNDSITDEQKAQLRGFRNTIVDKKKAIGYDNYDSAYSKGLIDSAIIKGAHAGLGEVAHKYQQDPSYNPLGWANYNLNAQKYKDALIEGEFPYTHSDENNPTPQNRTGLKPGYSIKNGKLQYNSGGGNGGNDDDYTITTPGISVHTAKEGTRTYGTWEQVNKGAQKDKVTNMPTVAIEDITDPDIQRELLNRINVPNSNIPDRDLDELVIQYLPQLKQITVQISGERGTRGYAWIISDKRIQRQTDKSQEKIDDKTV